MQPASRTAFVELSLTVADKYDKTYVGVYTMMEPVDKAFLRERFGSDKGMLLKPERIQGIPYLGENGTPTTTSTTRSASRRTPRNAG